MFDLLQTVRHKRVASQNEQKAKSFEQELERISFQHIDTIRDKDSTIKQLQQQLEELKILKTNAEDHKFESVDLNSASSDSAWKSFEWNHESQVNSQRNTDETSDLLDQISSLEDENESLRNQLEAFQKLEQQMAISMIEREASCEPETADACIQSTAADVVMEDTLSDDVTDDALSDFDPAAYNSLEQYSCTVIHRRWPMLARALSDVLIENQELKQQVHVVGSEESGNTSMCMTLKSGGSGSSADSNGSWHLVSSSCKQTPIASPSGCKFRP